MFSLLLRIIFLSIVYKVLVLGWDRDDVENMILDDRYPVEKHYVTTEDDYILGLHRIPSTKPASKVVLIMHGLFASASDFLVFGPNNSLGYVVFDAGYDVWLGNVRGTSFSRNHSSFDPNTSKEFWDYSFHEIGSFDIPAIIDYILKLTVQSALNYVCHSQGCTVFFVMASQRPEYLQKVRATHAMAPAVFLPKSQAVSQFVLDFMDQLETISRRINMHEVSTDNPEVREVFNRFAPLCRQSVFKIICVDMFFTTFGTTTPPMSKRMARHVLHNSPNIVSIKQLMHFGQIIKANRFQQFDYKEKANQQIYGQPHPPDYDLSGVNTNLSIYYGLGDVTSRPDGIQRLVDSCEKILMIRANPVIGFNHLDFIYSKDARLLVYDRIIKELKKF